MDKNQKNFNLYVFLSTFSRNLIEIFIPILLYKSGYGLKDVLYYYLIVSISRIILTYPSVKFANKKGYRILSIIGIIFFFITQMLLNNILISKIYLSLLAFCYASYRSSYWLARKFFSLKVVKKTNISKTYSLMSIVNQLGEVFAAYIGAMILDFVSSKVLIFISILLFLASIIPLKKLEIKKNNKVKISLLKTLKETPLQDQYLFMTY